jgi:hypothetical protein
MEFFVWAIIITIGLFIIMIPLALAVGGLALLISAIQKMFNMKS